MINPYRIISIQTFPNVQSEQTFKFLLTRPSAAFWLLDSELFPDARRENIPRIFEPASHTKPPTRRKVALGGHRHSRPCGGPPGVSAHGAPFDPPGSPPCAEPRSASTLVPAHAPTASGRGALRQWNPGATVPARLAPLRAAPDLRRLASRRPREPKRTGLRSLLRHPRSTPPPPRLSSPPRLAWRLPGQESPAGRAPPPAPPAPRHV